MGEKRRRIAAAGSAPSPPPAPPPFNSELAEAIEQAQAKAYESLGLAETIHLYAKPDSLFATTPRLIERILDKHYFDQSSATKAQVRRQLEDHLIARDKQSPLRLQNERYHRHLMYYWRLIEKHAPEFGIDKVPVVATMPIPQLNAETWKSRHQNGYAIIFNEGLLTFLFLLSKVVARYFPGEIVTNPSQRTKGTMSVLFDRYQVNRILTTDLSGLQDLVNLLTGHVYKGNPLADTKPYLLERQPNVVAGLLVAYSELFVFAHELAHIAHRDLEGAAPIKLPGIGEEFDVLHPDQQQELNADARALMCLIKVCEQSIGRYYLSLVYWAAELFFSAVELSERAVTFVKFGEEGTFHADTHPPIAVRRSNLRQVLQHHAPWESTLVPPHREWELAVNHAEVMVDLVNTLWSDARRALEVARTTGHPLSPRWFAI